MDAIVKKLKNLRGHITGYRAHFGPLNADAATAKEAVVALDTHLRATLKRFEEGTVIGTWRGHTYVVAPDTTGWRDRVDVFSRPDYWVTMGTAGRAEAVEDALQHLAKTVWEVTVEDDIKFVDGLPDKVQRELIWYFNWQRAYAVAKRDGCTDDEARAFAEKIQQHSGGRSMHSLTEGANAAG